MNDYRRLLTAWLPYLLPVLLLSALWLYLLGTEVSVQRPAPGPASSAEQVKVAPPAERHVVDLQTYSAVWELPLFADQRRPDPEQDADAGNPPPTFDDLLLTGVIVAPPLRVALLRQSGDQVLSLKEGDVLPNGWSLAHIEEQKVELTYGAHHHTLEISSPRLPMPIQ
jgi:general secretion pathway protein N